MEVQQLLRELVEAEKEEDEDEDRTAAREREREGRQICMQDRMSASLPPSLAGSPAGLSTLGLTLIHLGRLS